MANSGVKKPTTLAGDDPFGQIDPKRVFNMDYWAEFGCVTEPTMREKMLYVTIDDIGRVGGDAFNAKLMCDALGIAPSLVNHHFGGRNELVAEATVLCYKNYVQLLWEAVETAPRDPEARLRTWIETSIYWTTRMSGWGPILNYPKTSLAVTQILDEQFSQEMTDHAEINMSRLLILISDLKKGRISNASLNIGKLPRLKLLKDVDSAMLTASIGWSVLGIATWSAGRHLPTRGMKDFSRLEKMAFKKHIDRLIQSVKDEA